MTRRGIVPWVIVGLWLATAATALSADAKLEVWINEWTNDTRRWWVQEFYPAWRREHPDVEIAVYWQNWGTFMDRLVAATAAGAAPDVFQAGAEFVWEMAEGGFALPLDDYVSRWDAVGEYFPMTLETVRHKGSTYGIPVLSAPRTFLYRTDLLARFGYAPDAAATTWEELHEMAVRMTQGSGDYIEILGADPEWNFHKFFAFLWQNGGDVLSPDLSRPIFDDLPGIEALEFIEALNRDMLQGRTVRPGVGFRQGLVAIQYDSQHALRSVREFRPDDVQNVRVGYPTARKEQVTPVFNDWLAISRQAEDPDLAWEFIAFFSRPEHLSRYNETLFFIPPSREAVLQSAFLDETPGAVVFVEIVEKYGRPVPSFPNPARLAGAINEAIHAAVTGVSTPQAALAAAALEFRNELGR